MRSAILLALIVASPCLAANRDARIQTDERRFITCDFGVTLDSITSITAKVLTETNTDAACTAATGCSSPDGLFGGAAALVDGKATGSKVRADIDPDGDATNRNKNRYHVHMLVEDANGQRFACDGVLVVEDVNPGSL